MSSPQPAAILCLLLAVLACSCFSHALKQDIKLQEDSHNIHAPSGGIPNPCLPLAYTQKRVYEYVTSSKYYKTNTSLYLEEMQYVDTKNSRDRRDELFYQKNGTQVPTKTSITFYAPQLGNTFIYYNGSAVPGKCKCYKFPGNYFRPDQCFNFVNMKYEQINIGSIPANRFYSRQTNNMNMEIWEYVSIPSGLVNGSDWLVWKEGFLSTDEAMNYFTDKFTLQQPFFDPNVFTLDRSCPDLSTCAWWGEKEEGGEQQELMETISMSKDSLRTGFNMKN